MLAVAIHGEHGFEALPHRFTKTRAQRFALAAALRMAQQGHRQLAHDLGRAIVRTVVDHDDGDAQRQYGPDHLADRRLFIEAGNQYAPTGSRRIQASVSSTTLNARVSAAARVQSPRPAARFCISGHADAEIGLVSIHLPDAGVGRS
jgi:hypothetical protein